MIMETEPISKPKSKHGLRIFLIVLLVGIVILGIFGATSLISLNHRLDAKLSLLQNKIDKLGIALPISEIYPQPPKGQENKNSGPIYAQLQSEVTKVLQTHHFNVDGTPTPPLSRYVHGKLVPQAKLDAEIANNSRVVSQLLHPLLVKAISATQLPFYGATYKIKNGHADVSSLTYTYLSAVGRWYKISTIDSYFAAKSGDLNRYMQDTNASIAMSNSLLIDSTEMSTLISNSGAIILGNTTWDILKSGQYPPGLPNAFIQAISRWKEPNLYRGLSSTYAERLEDIALFQTSKGRQLMESGNDSTPSLSYWLAGTSQGQKILKTAILNQILAVAKNAGNQFSDPYACMAQSWRLLDQPMKQTNAWLGPIINAISPMEPGFAFQSIYMTRNHLTALAIVCEALRIKQSTGKYPTTLPFPSQLTINSSLFKSNYQPTVKVTGYNGTLTPQPFPHIMGFHYEVTADGFRLTFPDSFKMGKKSHDSQSGKLFYNTIEMKNGKLTQVGVFRDDVPSLNVSAY